MISHTEGSMRALLRRRFYGLGGNGPSGNGPQWAFAPTVRNRAGHEATRTADGIAMQLWPSKGLLLHGYEIKVSRSDWLRELKDLTKAGAFEPLVDRWWIVAGDATIVKTDELPAGWGLLVASGERLVQKRAAKPLRAETTTCWRDGIDGLPPEFGRSFLASLLRAACRAGEQAEKQTEMRIGES